MVNEYVCCPRLAYLIRPLVADSAVLMAINNGEVRGSDSNLTAP